MNTTQTLTAAQTKAARQLIAGETIHAYNGTSVATARALIELGIAQWAFKPFVHTTVSRVTQRPSYSAQWAIVASTELTERLAARHAA